MKKTVQVNLGGQIFTLDEDAYDALASYLRDVENHYRSSAGHEEILQDIEARIAEWFAERLGDNRSVVNIADVNAVIDIMGRPDQFEDESETEGGQARQDHWTGSKRLFKDPDDQVVGGVCSGIAHYFGLDPIWIRLAFVGAVVFAGTGVFLYLILLIVLPTANTVAEKTQMRGEPVDIDGIGRSIESEINAFGQRVSKSTNSFSNGTGKQITTAAGRFVQFISMIIINVFRGVGKILGVFFMFFGTALLVALVAGLFGVADVIHFGGREWSTSMDLYEWGQLVFTNSDWLILSIVSAVLVIGVPFLALAYGGFSLLFPNQRVPYLALGLFGLWFIGLMLSVFTGLSVAQSFSKVDQVVNQYSLDTIGLKTDTFNVLVKEDPFDISRSRAFGSRNDFLIKIEDEKIIRGNVQFTIEPYAGAEPILHVTKSATGATYDNAMINAQSISYDFGADSTNIMLNAFFSFPRSSKLRDQTLEVVLMMPEGLVVYLDPSVLRVIDNIPNVTNTYDPRMVNHYWFMGADGLECIDCQPKPIVDDTMNEDVLPEETIEI